MFMLYVNDVDAEIFTLACGGGRNDGDVALLRPREKCDSDVQRSTLVWQHGQSPAAYQREEQQDPRQREGGSVTWMGQRSRWRGRLKRKRLETPAQT
eukprot:CAMPEP_0194350028 /NCGR_PEP_ID=MMETSP0171-20130528/107413_1 /TAXON_ID=218684 /ORGANISM="Corethron pennatum, Strain L29A3" /LENGTH=96 /DNA_ID=CAMNT_0039117537 /DNA_START=623 /DNA_END=913 /DNA_ORIENTATION=+